MRRISDRSVRTDLPAVLRRVMGGERLRITVAGRDAADLVPIDQPVTWTSGARARELIAFEQADRRLSIELADAFPDSTDRL